MSKIYVATDNMITSLGFSTGENLVQLRSGQTGIRIVNDTEISPDPVPLSPVDSIRLVEEFSRIGHSKDFTRYEQLHIVSVNDALKQTTLDPAGKDTLFIFSTTKGNIDLLEKKHVYRPDRRRLFLWESARIVASYFGNPNKPIVVSNACISGVVAIIIASRLLREGRFQNVIVTGADILSEFVVSGFQSFKAISPEPCKPFDARRDGMSIGEGCGTIVLTLDQQYIPDEHRILVTGCSGSNDANHISGPSMTGEGLYTAIRNALDEADLLPVDIDFISAHGTATPYNDEMEAKALTMARLNNKPVNSLKGYFGHTLGAAGILESVAAIHSMKENLLIKTLGYSEHGVSCELNVVKELIGCEINRCIKTASGFGGCNAAILFEKK